MTDHALQLIGAVCLFEGRAELALVFKSQILCVVGLLEELGSSVIVGRDLLHLAFETPALLLRALVVPHVLEAFASVHVRESLSLLVLAEVHHQFGDLVGAFHLRIEVLLQVFLDVTLDDVLHVGLHFLLGHITCLIINIITVVPNPGLSRLLWLKGRLPVPVNLNQFNKRKQEATMVELNYLEQVPLGGFNFDNCIRNTALEAQTNMTHKSSFTKTGTTICGVVFNVSALTLHSKLAGPSPRAES